MTDYERIRAILDDAPPWRVEEDEDGYWSVKFTGDGKTTPVYAFVATVPREADARAIVVARNLAPALLAVAETTKRLLEAPIYWPFDNPYDERLASYEDTRAALDALYAEIKETLT